MSKLLGYVGLLGLVVCCVAVATTSLYLLGVAGVLCMCPTVYQVGKVILS